MPTVSQDPEVARIWWFFLLTGVVSVLAGLLAIVYPNLTLLALGIFAGVGLLSAGAIGIAEAIGGSPDSRALSAIAGVLSILAGLICLRRPGESLLAVVIVLGVYLVAAGIVRFVRSISDLEDRAAKMALGIIDVILGIVILALPQLSLVTLAVLFAISLITHGLYSVFAAFKLRALAQHEPQRPAAPIAQR